MSAVSAKGRWPGSRNVLGLKDGLGCFNGGQCTLESKDQTRSLAGSGAGRP